MSFQNARQRLNGYVVLFLSLIAVISFQLPSLATDLTFNFTLDGGYTTSAGAYKPDGTLVKTLWRKVYYPAGTHSFTWNGTDDTGTAVPAGSYEFRVIAHNIRYVWDGAISNTSQAQSGPSVHACFYPIHDISISGQNAFYVTGYNEAHFAFARFNTQNPQVVTKQWRWVLNTQFNRIENQPATVHDRSWSYTATDGTWAYFAAPVGTDPNTRANTYSGFVTASLVSDSSQAYFTNGVQIPEGPSNFPPIPNGIYAGSQPGLSGLAVQATGNLLAVAVAPDNKVYFFDKRSGAASGSLTVTAPGRIEFAPNGDLWVTTGTNVVRYTLTGSTNVWTVATTITGFSKPLDIGVHPSNNNIVIVADGGTSQQVKAYNSTGGSLWTYGTAGGYALNGGAAANNKFWFSDGSKEDTFVSVAPDGSFWVGDGGNKRNLHFSASRAYIDQIAYVPHAYTSSVDRNAPQRVFSEFLEFSVNYSQPAGTGWTLVKNWGAGLGSQYFVGVGQGLKQVTTFPNSRTYATTWDNAQQKTMLVELTGNNLRIIGQFDQAAGQSTTIAPNGDLIKTTVNTSSWTKRTLTGFDASNNPIWAAPVSLAAASTNSTDPAPRCCGAGQIAAPVTSSGVLVSYDQSLNNGFHLGGVQVGGSSWLWRAMPAVTNNVPIDGLGSYDIGNGVSYGGNTAMAVGRHIVAGYHGEFWNQTQAGQFMHFYDNGLFIGQFGVPGIGWWNAADGALAGFAGNGFNPSFVKTADGEHYVWVNDESAHGVQRWHIVGANNIREWSGSGTLGGNAVGLTTAAAVLPTNVIPADGNGRVGLTWNAVPSAISYNVKYSATDGGPYTTIPNVGDTNYVVTGLTNGTRYYFVVSAVTTAGESSNSDQVMGRPLDTSLVVQTAGEQSTRDKTFDIKSSAPAAGFPALTGLNKLAGDLTLTDIGSKGYYLFNWGGAGVDNANVLSPFTVTKGSGWVNNPYLQGNFRVDGVSSSDYGLFSNPSGAIDINVSDSNFHLLTVFCPAKSADTRTFTIKLTPQGQTSPVASYAVTAETPGRNHTYQFRFKGNVRLTVDSTGGAVGTVQALFLDDVRIYNPPQIAAVGHAVDPIPDTHVTYAVSSTAPGNGQPALTGLSGLALNSVGTKGYVIYNWGGTGIHSSNVLAPFSIGIPTGFTNQGYLKNRFDVDSVAGSISGLYSNPSGSIPINVSDGNVHTLTVFSADRFADARTFTIQVTPQGLSTPSASYVITNENPGKNHIFQFQFTGNITLKVNTPTDWQQVGVVQALFLD